MAPREIENNAYVKFWVDKQRAIWYVMVFSGVANLQFSLEDSQLFCYVTCVTLYNALMKSEWFGRNTRFVFLISALRFGIFYTKCLRQSRWKTFLLSSRLSKKKKKVICKKLRRLQDTAQSGLGNRTLNLPLCSQALAIEWANPAAVLYCVALRGTTASRLRRQMAYFS